MTTFEDRLRIGREGEELVKIVFAMNGFQMLHPGSSQPGVSGPVVTVGKGVGLTIPDLAAIKDGATWWIEVKSWWDKVHHHKTDQFRHGVSATDWKEYITFQRQSGLPMSMAFYERRTGIVRWAPLLRLCTAIEYGDPGHERFYGGKRQVFFPVNVMDEVFNLYKQLQYELQFAQA